MLSLFCLLNQSINPQLPIDSRENWNSTEEMSSKPHVLLVPSPGMGHLIPLLELANCLVTHHNFQATVLVVSSNTSPAQSHVIQSAMTPKLFDIIELPQLDASGHHFNAAGSVFTQLSAIMRDAQASIRSAISAMEIKPAAMIVDLFGTAALTVANEFHMLRYVTLVSCAWPLTLMLYAHILDTLVEGEYLDQTEPLKIPGCKPVQPEDVVKPMMNRKDPEYESFIRIGLEIPSMSDGILINTWEDLEPATLAAMREHPEWKQIVKVPVYTIGPMVRLAAQPSGGPRSEILDWLDKQPNESVIYISFGSGGVLSAEQITEMAWGLEFSGQRFIWVVQPPSRGGDKGNDISEYLPQGFMARTMEKGVVVTTWAPQSEILAHSSIGGFLSHCGWNSSLESILNGVPMIAWPLYAEQKMVARLLVEELKVAIRPKVLPTKATVGREEIEMMVRKIMDQEGDAMRAKAKEMKESGEAALREGGSTFNTMSKLAKLCKNNTQRQGQNV